MVSKGLTKSTKRSTSLSDSVETFLASLEHPLKQEILALRQIILDADSGIAEGIKWNAPSFRTTEYFATLRLQAKEGIQVILHRGAKIRELPPDGIVIDDPEVLLQWLGKDRASATFRDVEEIDAKRAAFVSIIRQWITYV